MLEKPARDLAEEIKPVIFNIISEISEKDLRQMNPTELKGLLDVCYKIIANLWNWISTGTSYQRGISSDQL